MYVERAGGRRYRSPMLTRIGPPAPAGDAVDALVDCHQRIRSFTDLALRLSRTPGLADADVRDAAARVRRYFAEALPLHARDEEESVLPRLRGRDPGIDRELEAMHREHAEHGAAVGRVLAACEELLADPASLPRLADRLELAARELERHFGLHLEREERVIFPALRRLLDAPALDLIRAEMRARRAAPT